jgi:hypothetical protein
MRTPFPASLAAFVVVCVFDDNCSEWSEVKYQRCFDLHFLYTKDVGVLSCNYWPFVLPLLWIVSSDHFPICSLGS